MICPWHPKTRDGRITPQGVIEGPPFQVEGSARKLSEPTYLTSEEMTAPLETYIPGFRKLNQRILIDPPETNKYGIEAKK